MMRVLQCGAKRAEYVCDAFIRAIHCGDPLPDIVAGEHVQQCGAKARLDDIQQRFCVVFVCAGLQHRSFIFQPFGEIGFYGVLRWREFVRVF
ncbi:MAG: hypothetical protein FCKEOINB_00250 [Nitrosomonas sp.]|nr:hypothetical protein [Nitrosomonas sp.]